MGLGTKQATPPKYEVHAASSVRCKGALIATRVTQGRQCVPPLQEAALICASKKGASAAVDFGCSIL